MWRLIACLLFFPLFTSGQIPDPLPGTYVNDFSHNLAANEIQQLNERLYRLEQQTTVQVAILLINNLPDGTTIEDYARDIGNKWKVGRAYNGLVYVAVLEEHLQRLEVARHLEGDIPDITASEIIKSVKPYLRQREYYQGLDLLITQIQKHTSSETNESIETSRYPDSRQVVVIPPPLYNTESDFERKKTGYDRLIPYVLGVLFCGAIAFLIWAWRYRKKYYEMYTVDGVYRGIGSSYYHDSTDSGSFGGDSSDFGGWGDGGGFDGGGASDSW